MVEIHSVTIRYFTAREHYRRSGAVFGVFQVVYTQPPNEFFTITSSWSVYDGLTKAKRGQSSNQTLLCTASVVSDIFKNCPVQAFESSHFTENRK